VNLGFKYIEGESIVLDLDMEGIGTSTGSACSSKSLDPSHVLLAIGLKPEEAHGSLRVSLGRFTIEEEVNYFLEKLPPIIDRLRKMSPLKKGVKYMFDETPPNHHY
jgi:cysteine desulfurase